MKLAQKRKSLVIPVAVVRLVTERNSMGSRPNMAKTVSEKIVQVLTASTWMIQSNSNTVSLLTRPTEDTRTVWHPLIIGVINAH